MRILYVFFGLCIFAHLHAGRKKKNHACTDFSAALVDDEERLRLQQAALKNFIDKVNEEGKMISFTQHHVKSIMDKNKKPLSFSGLYFKHSTYNSNWVGWPRPYNEMVEQIKEISDALPNIDDVEIGTAPDNTEISIKIQETFLRYGILNFK